MARNFRNWYVLGFGLIVGLLYASSEWYLDYYAKGGDSTLSIFLHDALEWLLPLTLGLAVAIGINLFLKQKELNTILSTENTKLKSNLLTNTFASYILHEVRNPLHNLSAVFEKPNFPVPGDTAKLINSNLARLTTITAQLKQMSTLSEEIDIYQTVPFSAWLNQFVNHYLTHTFRRLGIKYEQEVEPFSVKVHPLLLDQCFTLLFDNALTAVQESSEKPVITLTGTLAEDRKNFAKIILRNSGSFFPEEVLRTGGKAKVESKSGSGLGLFLVQDTLKHVSGEIQVRNTETNPEVILYLPLGASQ